MKNITDVLKKKIPGQKTEPDEKTIVNIFFSVLERRIRGMARADVNSVKLVNRKLSVKANHPAIAGEIWRRRERIRGDVNELIGEEYVEAISAK